VNTSLQQERPSEYSAAVFVWAGVAYALVLVVFWFIAKGYAMEYRVGGHMPSTFATFAMLLAPYWFFAFGLADVLTRALRGTFVRVAVPGLLVIPYLVSSWPRGEFRIFYALIFLAVPVFLSALFEFVRPADHGLSWQDVVALLLVGIPVEFGKLRGAFPHPGLAVLPKFLLMDALVYAYLVIRRLPGVGYDLRLRWRDFCIGLREWAFFAPIAIVLGLAIGFIRFRGYWPDTVQALSAWLITFFFVALPEEFFFRGLLQNMLERRLRSRGYLVGDAAPSTSRIVVNEQEASHGSAPEAQLSPAAASRAKYLALLLASIIFGLSHFNKPLPFNWRYVILASIAGVFYGRAWLDRRRLGTSAITHATVDVVWGLWFR
jgi:membrane protease YdiL (CAAX protease family)